MLNTEQTKNLTYVYGQLLLSENDNKSWNDIDCLLEMNDWLSDEELYTESEILYTQHKDKNMGCLHKHSPGSICFVTNILEAVDSIIELYRENKRIHPKNRYILIYYMSLCQDGSIVELLNS